MTKQFCPHCGQEYDNYKNARQEVCELLLVAGSQGMTRREFQRSKVKKYGKAVVEAVLLDMADERLIKKVITENRGHGAGGAPRRAWVMTQRQEPDAYDMETPSFCPSCSRPNPGWPDCESCGHRFDQ